MARWEHVFVAKNAMQQLRTKRRVLVDDYSKFILFDVALLAFSSFVLCICVLCELSATSMFVAVFYLFSFPHLYAVSTYVSFVFAPITVDKDDLALWTFLGSLFATTLSFMFSDVFLWLF